MPGCHGREPAGAPGSHPEAARVRVDGYCSAMNAAGLEIDLDHIRFGNFLPGEGERHGAELLAGPNPPTAIFAGSGLRALGVIAAAAARGLSVPRDLSVVGYDEITSRAGGARS
ncbi:substrate-binding domain-containing protein [Microbacterium chocolatum]|uniref:substrate-binding domain-containing protein n=1 Tax=Microbacterium aurantiacum TaxID=162393 RepID=UPI00338E60D9